MPQQSLLLSTPTIGVALIKLNRPEARNAIDMPMQQALDQLLVRLEQDDQVRAVILTGSGDKAFCSGYDIHEMQTFGPGDLAAAQLKRDPWIWNIATYSKPLISAINGLAHGAGAIIATASDIRIGCSQTNFRYTAGLYGGANNTWNLAPVVGLARAKEYILTARKVHAEEALQAGLLNHLVSDSQLLAKAIEIATLIAANPPEGMRESKKLLHANIGCHYESAFQAEITAMSALSTYAKPPADIFSKFLSNRPSKGTDPI